MTPLGLSPLDPLAMLLSFSGVALVVFVVWLGTRRAAPLRLGGEAAIRDQLARELLGFELGELAVSSDDQGAVAVSADGRELALVFLVGRRPTFWRLPLGKLQGATLRPSANGQAAVDLATGELTRPSVSFNFDDAAQIQRLLGERLSRAGANP